MPKIRSHGTNGSGYFAIFRTTGDSAIRGLAKRGAESPLEDRRHRVTAPFREKFFAARAAHLLADRGPVFPCVSRSAMRAMRSWQGGAK